MSLDAAAQVLREAMHESIKRHSLWYVIQAGLMIIAGILTLVLPSSVVFCDGHFSALALDY